MDTKFSGVINSRVNNSLLNHLELLNRYNLQGKKLSSYQNDTLMLKSVF